MEHIGLRDFLGSWFAKTIVNDFGISDMFVVLQADTTPDGTPTFEITAKLVDYLSDRPDKRFRSFAVWHDVREHITGTFNVGDAPSGDELRFGYDLVRIENDGLTHPKIFVITTTPDGVERTGFLHNHVPT